MYYKCERFQPAQGLKLNGLNGQTEWSEADQFRPFSLTIQTVQFLAPVQFETFPIYI